MNLIKSLSSNTTSFESRFGRRFLPSLMKIKTTPPTLSSPREIFLRSRKVKIAADQSMVLAVGSRRAWSRAMLWKIRYRARRHRVSVGRVYKHPNIRKKCLKAKKTKNKIDDSADVLRKLVPGCEGMDFCRLLDETAHYLKCLVTQVQVMTSIAEFYSL